jgi:hypothetical protein
VCVPSGVGVCFVHIFSRCLERQATGNPLTKRSALSSGEKAVEHRSGAQTGGVVYWLQEGSLVVVQEGANHVVYRLQEGSPVSAQAGTKNRGF